MPTTLLNILLIGLAGALGAVTRYGVMKVFGWTTYPLGTLVINLTGSLFLGWFMTVVSKRVDFSETWRLAIGVGFVGAYTTFSTFMFESDKMIQDAQWLALSSYLAGSLFLGLLAVRCGVILGQHS